MRIDPNNFLLSLAAAMATSAGVELAGTPRGLWVHEAVEASAAEVYTVMRIYGGAETASFAGHRRGSLAIQRDTRGMDPQLVLAEATALHETLLDDQDRPRMHWSLAGKRFAADGSIEADPDGRWIVRQVRLAGLPGIVGRDEAGRWMASANMDVEFDRD